MMMMTVFELRKNNWLSHGQPDYNTGCLSKFLVVRTWNNVNGVEFHSCGIKFMVVGRTTISVFLVVRRLFWLSRAHGQPDFRTLVISTVLPMTVYGLLCSISAEEAALFL